MGRVVVVMLFYRQSDDGEQAESRAVSSPGALPPAPCRALPPGYFAQEETWVVLRESVRLLFGPNTLAEGVLADLPEIMSSNVECSIPSQPGG